MLATGEAGSGSVGSTGCSPDGRAPRDRLLGRQELEERIVQLEEAVRTQRQIGVLIGILAERSGCTTAEAWGIVVRLSQDTNIKVREIARVVGDAFDGRTRAEDAVLLNQVLVALSVGHGRGRVTGDLAP